MSTSLNTSPLYRITNGELKLLFGVCGACAAKNFPANAYGCMFCGASSDGFVVQESSAQGVLRNFVTVHVAITPLIPPPYVVGEVELAKGVVQQALMNVADESGLHVGMPVVATVCSPDVPGAGEYPLRFKPQTPRSQR